MKNTNQPEVRTERRTLLQMIRQRHPLRIMLAIALIVVGCTTYYKAVPVEPTTATLENLRYREHKYFVLHIDKGDFAWQDVRVDVHKELVVGTIAPLTEQHLFYEKTRPEGKATAYTVSSGDPTEEVHIYGGHYTMNSLQVALPVSSIERIDVYEFDGKATRKAKTIRTVVGITLGVAILAAITIAIIASSFSFSISGVGGFGMCPDIYVSTGTEYVYSGEVYPGALCAPMERDDYLQLASLAPVNGTYSIRIAGKGSESDQTNLAELAIVEHSPQAQVAFDLNGQAHSIADAQSAIQARNRDDRDVLPLVVRADSAYAFFDDAEKADRSMSTIDMRFDRPKDQKEAKLLIRGSSTEWQRYVYEKFIEQFGSDYHAYAEAQAKKPAAEHYAWLQAQGLSLSVYVETPKGWVLQGAIPPTGAWVDRDIVVPVDLADVPGDEVNVRLSCAFMAWQVDHVGLDFSPDEKMRIITIPPFTATDEKGQDVTHLLTATDHHYLVQADSGSVVSVTYLAPPQQQDRAYTAFLHGRGYYTLNRNYTHAPNPGFTKTFERDGQFAKFSRERYDNLIEQYSQMTGQDAGEK